MPYSWYMGVQPTWSTCPLSSSNSSTSSASRRLLEDFTQEHMAQRRKLLVDPADTDSVTSATEALKGAFCCWSKRNCHHVTAGRFRRNSGQAEPASRAKVFVADHVKCKCAEIMWKVSTINHSACMDQGNMRLLKKCECSASTQCMIQAP